jgi:hypothetical protein
MIRSPLDGLRSPFGGVFGRVGGGGGGGPVNIVAPAITGALTQGADLTFDLGIWSGATSFEISVTQTSPTSTLLARQSVTGTTTGTVASDVGGTLTLNVWATGPGGVTLAASAPFGPIIAAGDEWIIGLVFNASTSHNPTPSGAPVTWTLVAPNAASNLYSAGVGWGFVGTIAASTTTNFSTQSKGDPRINGRLSVNVQPSDLGIRVDIPSTGDYVIHAGFGASSTVTPRITIRDGGPTASVLYEINAGNTISVTSAQTMDIAGNVRTNALWVAESVHGGTPIEVTATGSSLWIGRPSSTGAPMLNCIAILKKAA